MSFISPYSQILLPLVFFLAIYFLNRPGCLDYSFPQEYEKFTGDKCLKDKRGRKKTGKDDLQNVRPIRHLWSGAGTGAGKACAHYVYLMMTLLPCGESLGEQTAHQEPGLGQNGQISALFCHGLGAAWEECEISSPKSTWILMLLIAVGCHLTEPLEARG